MSNFICPKCDTELKTVEILNKVLYSCENCKHIFKYKMILNKFGFQLYFIKKVA